MDRIPPRRRGSKNEKCSTYNAEDCIKLLGASKPIDKLSTEDIDGLIAQLKDRELSGGTIRRKLASLSTIIRYASQRHWIKAAPIIDRKAAGKERKRLRFISQEEETNLLTYLRGYACSEPGMGGKVADFFTFLIDTGLRLSEGLFLNWTELDGDKAVRLGFDNKGEQPRLVPLTERSSAIIKERRKARQQGERRVFPEMSIDRAEYFWRLVRESLKLTKDNDPDFVIHACRHTFASRLAMQGVPLNVIKELGGWKTLDMVLRYAHLTPQVKEDAIKKMQAWGKTGTEG